VTAAAEAERLGFRACKRCKPEIDNFEDTQAIAARKAVDIIDNFFKEQDAASTSADQGLSKRGLSLRQLAEKVGLTPRYFHKVFKDQVGCTPKDYLRSRQEVFSPSEDAIVGADLSFTDPTWDAMVDDLLRWDELEPEPGLSLAALESHLSPPDTCPATPPDLSQQGPGPLQEILPKPIIAHGMPLWALDLAVPSDSFGGMPAMTDFDTMIPTSLGTTLLPQGSFQLTTMPDLMWPFPDDQLLEYDLSLPDYNTLPAFY